MPDKTPNRPRIFLNNAHLKGFRSIDDLYIDFQRGLNILIGKNGSGKSNFMDFLYQANWFTHSKSIYKYANLGFISSDNHLISIELENKFQEFNEDIDNIDERIKLFEKITIDNNVCYDSFNEELNRSFLFNNKKIIFRGGLGNLFRSLGFERLSPFYITFSLPDNIECLTTPGTLKADLEDSFLSWNYPSTLDFIRDVFFHFEMTNFDSNGSRKEINKTQILRKFKINHEIISNLKRFSPIDDVRFISNINVYKDDKSIIIENIKLEFKINRGWLPWAQLSDGTKRLFYIIAEVIFAKGLVLIEEPEIGVHPHQFNQLMNFLKEQSEQKQIIISTHSPKALDHLTQDELNSILVTQYDSKRGTTIRHLTHKEITKGKKYMKEVGFFSDYWVLSDLEE